VAEEDDAFDVQAFRLERLEKELLEQGRTSPLPPWLKYPSIPRYSIGWRMGGGESYLMVWWRWGENRSQEEKIAYFREFAPIQLDWVDWVGMQFEEDDDEKDENLSFDELIERAGERIAHLGLFDVEAWRDSLRSDPDATATEAPDM
jgi:hypothetical protein